jgi:hypothetical protein
LLSLAGCRPPNGARESEKLATHWRMLLSDDESGSSSSFCGVQFSRLFSILSKRITTTAATTI